MVALGWMVVLDRGSWLVARPGCFLPRSSSLRWLYTLVCGFAGLPYCDLWLASPKDDQLRIEEFAQWML